ncbi:MAG: GntR family transcriptional regulator [Gemmiger sp.]
MKKSESSIAANRLGGALISAQVVERLTSELRTGRYRGCDRLPAETELAESLGVSRTVVRDALSELEREGYIERVRGIGTVVNHGVVQLDNRLDQKLEFYSMIEAVGFHPRSDHVQVIRQEADEKLAASLELQPGETVLCICKRVLADDTPVIYSTDMIPLKLFGDRKLDSADFSVPVFELLRRYCDIQTASSVTHVSAVVGDPAVRRLLGLTPDKALLMLDETCYSRLCRPVMRCFTYYTDFFDFAMLRKLL